MKALRLALLSMFVATTIIGVNSCRDEFDEKEALELEHAFLLQLQQQRDDARRQALLDSVQAAQAGAQQAAADQRALIELQSELQAKRDELFLKGGSINYAVNVVDGNSTTFSGNTSNGRTSSEDMSGFVVTVFHQELGTVANATTDATGYAVFPDLRVGKVTVNVLKPGFTPANFVADITPSSPFEKPTAVGESPAGDPNGYVRSAGTVIPVFEIELGNVFQDPTTQVPADQLNRYSTISGKMNVETDLTNFGREAAPAGTLISFSINADDATFRNVINRATNNTFGSTDGNSNGTASGTASGTGNTPGEGNNISDGAEGDGRIIQLSYSDASFTGVVSATGDYTVIVPAFPTGAGLPFRVNHSTIAADQTLYDVISREVNNTNAPAVWGVVTKRAVFAPVAAAAQTTVPDFNAVDVSVASPLANVDAQGASARAYIDDNDGGIDRVVMVNGGHNYYAAPYVVFTAGGQGPLDGYTRQELQRLFEDPNSPVYDDDVARGTATVENGVVTGVAITNRGAGYTTETVAVTFIPRGTAPTFAATINSGGGCLPVGTTWTVPGGFTQVPNATPVGLTADTDPSTPAPSLTNKFTVTVAGGTATITLNEEVCGIEPNSTISFRVWSKVSSMMKLRPIVSQEGGAIGALTIAEGTYNALPASTGVITDDNITTGSTNQEVLNGLYSQAPLVKITGAGTGASATATLANNKVDKITVVGGTNYDRPNTTIRVESSVQDANGNATRASFVAKFIPVGGATTIGGANDAARTTVVAQGGTFYTKGQFEAFNANNTSNNLVTLDATYGAIGTVAATTQSNTALFATAAGTPLNPFYSINDGTGTVVGAGIPATTTADTDDNDKISGNVSTPGVRFANGGQGYSEDSDITVMAVDADNTRTANTGNPFPGDVNDQAQFDYALAEGYVTEVTFESSAAIPATQGPLGIVLGQLPNGTYDINGDGVNDLTVVAGNDTNTPEVADLTDPLFELDRNGTDITDDDFPQPLVDIDGAAAAGGLAPFAYQPGQLDISTPASGSGIRALRPVAGSIGGRFAQTPELQVSGPGTGFEYRFVMDFQYAIQPVLASFITGGYSLYLLDASTNWVAPPALPVAGADKFVTLRFRDIQAGAGAPTTPAEFQAQFNVANITGDFGGDPGINDVQLNYVTGTFSGLNNGGAGYNPVNLRTMVLSAFEATTGTVTKNILDANDVPQLHVDNGGVIGAADDDADPDQTFTFDGADTRVEGLSSITLGGRIVEIVADNGRTGTGYSAHPTNTYTIQPTGYSENVPTSAEIGAVTTTPTTNGIEFTGGTGLTGSVISSGDGFPYVNGTDNKQFIRLLRRDGTFVPRTDIKKIKVARRIGHIRIKPLPSGLFTSLSSTPATDAAGMGQALTAYDATPGNVAGVTYTKGVPVFFYTPAVGTGGAVAVEAAFAGKTVAAIDGNNDGDYNDVGVDYWGMVGNGYATPNIPLTIMARNFAGGAPDDAAAAEVRSSGLKIGSVRINSGVVHPTIATRSTGADPVISVTTAPAFRFRFAAPDGTSTFGTPTTAGSTNGGVANSQTTVAYPYNGISPTQAYMLEEVQITSGGANYSDDPFFRVLPNAGTLIDGTAQGKATAAAGAVTLVTIASKGAYRGVIPNVTLNDYLRRLYLREEEEGTGSARLRINGVGTLSGVLVDNAGVGYDAVGTNGSVVPNLLVVSKGNDFNDKNNDGIFQSGEHRGTQATVEIRQGADLANLTSADFVVTNAGDGYTQDPDIIVWTHTNEYVAIPRRSDNPIIVEQTVETDGPNTTAGTLASLRAFVVENNSATNFAEQPFVLTEAGDPNDNIEETELWADAVNQGKRPVTVAALTGAIEYDFSNNNTVRATNRTNEGVISAITIVTKGDNLVSGTYPLVIQGGGTNVSTLASASVVVSDGQAQSITNLVGGAGYDDSALNPGPDGVFDPASTFSNGTTAAVPAAGSDDSVGVQVSMLLGAGASAEAIPDAINVGTIEVTDGGAGYNNEPFGVRIVPAAADRNAGTTVAQYLANPLTVAPNVVEARVSAVTVNATTGAIESITVDPANPGFGYTTTPEVVIENFEAILRREAEAAFRDNANTAAGAAFNFDDFVTAKVAVEVDAATGAISKVDIINPGFGYIASPEIRVLGIGDGAVLTAGGINFLGGIDAQTGVADYQGLNFGYFLKTTPETTGSVITTKLPFIDFADHRLNSVTITNGGAGYLGGNFPRGRQAFSATLKGDAGTLTELNGFTVNVPAGVSIVHDVYYGTGVRNASEVSDTGTGAGQSTGDNQ